MKKYTLLLLLFFVLKLSAQTATNYKFGTGLVNNSVSLKALDTAGNKWGGIHRGNSNLSTLSPCQILLTSAVGTDSQNVCASSPITKITYSVSDSSATVTGLPTGINGVYNANIFTITGSSTLSGVFNYTVVSSVNCSVVKGYISNGKIPLVLPIATAGGSQSICPTATATISGASASNDSILWTENGSGNITFGAKTLTPIYTATIADAGKSVILTMRVSRNNSCNIPTSVDTAIATYTVNVNANPTATMSGGVYDSLGSTLPKIIFVGHGGTAPYKFIYFVNHGLIQKTDTVVGDSVIIKIPFKIGNSYAYKLRKVQDGKECYSFKTDSISCVVDPLSINKFTKNNIGEFFPNPFNDHINVISYTSSLIKITDITGKEVYNNKVNLGTTLIEIGNINSGIYFITITNNQGTITKKMIKN